MSSDLNRHNATNNDTGHICIDQEGEWDISLFDELDNLGDADELLQALESIGYAGDAPDLGFDLDLPPWSSGACGDTASIYTDGDITVDSLSPNHTLSSVSSPASVEAHSPYSLPDEALSLQSQPSPVSVCSNSSGFFDLTPERRAPKRTNQVARAKSTQPVKRPIQLTPKVSIQPRPVITAIPLPHAAAPLQGKTIIIQPLQTVLPVVKPPHVTIQPAPPTGRPVLLSQPAQVVHLQTPQTVPARIVTMPTLVQDRRTPAAAPPVVAVTLQSPASDDDMCRPPSENRTL